MSLRTEMSRYAANNQGKTPAALAAGFLSKFPRRLLIPLMVEEFVHIQRENVRGVEAFARNISTFSQRGSRRTLASIQADLSKFSDLLDQPYRIGDGRERYLRYMTESEHQARIIMLERQRVALGEAIDVHRWALDRIREARKAGLEVACLDDVERGTQAA